MMTVQEGWSKLKLSTQQCPSWLVNGKEEKERREGKRKKRNSHVAHTSFLNCN